MSGPLGGVTVIEMAGQGPGPFCAMLLSDMGADVIRIDRRASGETDLATPPPEVWLRGRRSVAIDMKHPAAAEVVLSLVERADVLIEGYRPGVAERLGIGPDVCLQRNPRLVFGRVTGWGQDGPYAQMAGHDINYIALSGALEAMGRPTQPPSPPLNLVGDYGGGGMLLAFGVMCALWESSRSGCGQVIDAAMTDGTILLTSVFHGLRAAGRWNTQRGTNFLDGAAPYYDTYETADGKYFSVGAMEPQFYSELLRCLGINEAELPSQDDQRYWPQTKSQVATAFRSKTRDQWCEILEGSDACAAPVLSFDEAPHHRHNRARGSYLDCAGATQPAPAPKFSRTPGAVRRPPAHPGQHTTEVLHENGFTPDRLSSLYRDGVIFTAASTAAGGFDNAELHSPSL